MKHFFIFLALITPNSFHVDGELMPYYNGYMNMLKTHCNITHAPIFSMEFGNCPDNDCIGYCDPGKLKQTVVISKKYWNKVDEFQREQLAFHELSHCILNARHSDDKDNFMYKYTPVDISRAEFYNQVNEVMEKACHR